MLIEQEIAIGPVARNEWCRLPKGVRRDVIKTARKGRAYPDRTVAIKAVGWARVVLGPPEARRRLSIADRLLFMLDVVTMTTPGSNIGMDILDGSATYDTQPWVRHVARQIERANPVGQQDQ